MRVALDCLVRFVLAPFLLVAAFASVSQAQLLVVTPVEPEAVSGPIEIARASTQVAGSDNLLYVHNNQIGSDAASFLWESNVFESYSWMYDGEILELEVDGTTVSRFSTDRIQVLFIQCSATAADSAAYLTWNIDQADTPGMLIPGGSRNGFLSVDANGETGQAVRFTGPVFYDFVIDGSIRHTFENPPTADGLSCAFVASSKIVNDRDGDGFLDSVDVCPDTYDPEQVDTDEDGRGDKCDICRTTPDRGKADDFDSDGVPDPCDNCPRSFCVESPTLMASDCYNPSQADLEFDVGEDGVAGVPGVDERLCPPDPLDLLKRPAPVPGSDDICGDGVGGNETRGCDNCAFKFNPGQEDDDLNGTGNVCAPAGAIQEFAGEVGVAPPAGAASLLSSVAALPGETVNLVGNGSSRISLQCGAFSAVEFTVGVSLPPSAVVSFGGCDPTTGSCASAPVCSILGETGCLQPVVDGNESFTLGPGLAAPPGVPSNVFYLHIEAGPEIPAPGDPLDRLRICQPNQQVELGFLDVSGLDANQIISLTTAGLDALGFPLILDADPAVQVQTSETTTTDLAETETVVLTISPSINDGSGLTETQLTLFSDLRITNLCLGLQAPSALEPTDVTVGDCNQTHTISNGAGALGVQVCGAGASPPERGPGIADGVTTALPGSFVVRPNEPTAAFLGLAADTTYFLMQGALPQFVPGSGLANTVNNPGQDSLLGTHRYEDEQRAAPVVVFDGCQAILDFVSDAGAPDILNVFPGGDPVALAEISRVATFDPQGDLDGDGVSNDDDNCINAINALQLDQGRVALNTTDARIGDGAGDVCQCGDGQVAAAAEPGSVLLEDSAMQSDLVECRRAAAGDPTLDAGALARCSVAGGFEVSAADLLLLSQALDPSIPDVTPNDIEQVCQPALVPVPDEGE